MRRLLLGMAAGAAGTAALNVVTYIDMAIRGRPSSSVPATMVDRLSDKTGIPFASANADEDTVNNRRSVLGALLGYETGIGLGAGYGLVRPMFGGSATFVPGVLLAAAAMAASDVPATVLGVTNPRKWAASSWVSDIVPHLAYGLVTAAVFNAFKR